MSRRRKAVPAPRPGLTPAGPLPEWVACIWLPHFPIVIEQARHPELAGVPLVLVAAGERGSAAVLQACSPEALASGLAVGSPAHSVSQRCPGAVLLPFDSPFYLRRYEELLVGLDTITPVVEAEPFEVFYLDLTRLPHLDAEDPEQV